MEQDRSRQKKKPSYPVIMVRGGLFVLSIGACIFILAGRISYWQGWLYAGSYLVVYGVFFVAFANKKELLAERAKPGPGTKWWDKIFIVLYIPTSLSVIVVGSLDAGRFGWTGALPVGVCIIAYIVLLLCFSVVLWAMWTNTFFSRAVRIQTDRGHYVVEDGPYRFVRHPGYLAGIFSLISTALVLGSLWALIPAVLSIALILVRTWLEDTTLKKELAGYAEYAEKVRFRLVPGVW